MALAGSGWLAARRVKEPKTRRNIGLEDAQLHLSFAGGYKRSAVRAVFVFVIVTVLFMLMSMLVIVLFVVRVSVRVWVRMRDWALAVPMRVGVIMHVEFHAADTHLLSPRHVQMPVFELELTQLPLQGTRVNAKINQRADEHVATDAAEDVEVEGFHYHQLFSRGGSSTHSIKFPFSSIVILIGSSRTPCAAITTSAVTHALLSDKTPKPFLRVSTAARILYLGIRLLRISNTASASSKRSNSTVFN